MQTIPDANNIIEWTNYIYNNSTNNLELYTTDVIKVDNCTLNKYFKYKNKYLHLKNKLTKFNDMPTF